MNGPVPTSDIKRPFYINLRLCKKARVLDTLRQADGPLSVGDLFLKTGLNHPILKKILEELHTAGYIDMKFLEKSSTTCSGRTSCHTSIHWFIKEASCVAAVTPISMTGAR